MPQERTRPIASGTQGYREEAEALVPRYERLPFEEKHREVLPLLSSMLQGAPCSMLDIGAGTGADAAVFAARGHRVVAVEPTDELRLPGMALHPSPSIEWSDDSLPDLEKTRQRGQTFDLVLMSGVWMHLDEQERERGMPNVASLIRKGGLLILSLRHGPVPPGRRMFEVSAEETIRLAQAHGLRVILNRHAESIQPENRQAGVTWSHLAFEAGGDA